MGVSPGVYRPRRPQNTPFYQCLDGYWEEFKEAYPYFYEANYGQLRPVVEKTVHRFLECGIYRHGFARILCPDCSQEYLLAFSCKTRYFCPSCQAKRVAAFVEWVTGEVLEPVPHRQLVWTIPKALRPAFWRDRKLLGELSRCAWRSLRLYLQHALGSDTVPAGVLAIQTYGDQLNFHPHLHSLVAEGGWGRDDGTFQSVSWLNSDILSAIFRQQVLEMMVQKRRLSPAFAHKISHWRHSGGFQVCCSQTVETDDRQALERLAAYILRPSFAATRLRYQPSTGQVHYRTAKGVARSMDTLDWIAQVISHIPDPGAQMVRYYGWYSNASRGKRRLGGQAAAARASSHEPETEAGGFSRARRQNWARLLRKIYEVDPFTCPRCLAPMKVVALIEQPEIIRQILHHLKLWEARERAPPPRLFAHKLDQLLASLSPEQARQVQLSTDSIFWDDVPAWPDS